jgi:hypothetical protein
MSEANRKTTTTDRLTTVLSYGALLLLGYLVFRITAPFLVPLAWSAVLAIFFFGIPLSGQAFLGDKAALFSTIKGNAGLDRAGLAGAVVRWTRSRGDDRKRPQPDRQWQRRGTDEHGRRHRHHCRSPCRARFYGAIQREWKRRRLISPAAAQHAQESFLLLP